MQGMGRDSRLYWNAEETEKLKNWKTIKPEKGIKTIEHINNCIQKFDLVLLVMDGSGVAENLTENFLNSKALQKASKKILVLSDQNVPYTNVRHQYHQLSARELDAIRNIYFMYDFSDHFRVLSYSRQYGGLLDYVNSGLLSMEGVFQAVLGP